MIQVSFLKTKSLPNVSCNLKSAIEWKKIVKEFRKSTTSLFGLCLDAVKQKTSHNHFLKQTFTQKFPKVLTRLAFVFAEENEAFTSLSDGSFVRCHYTKIFENFKLQPIHFFIFLYILLTASYLLVLASSGLNNRLKNKHIIQKSVWRIIKTTSRSSFHITRVSTDETRGFIIQ